MKANDETNAVVPFFGQSNASTAQQVMSKLKGENKSYLQTGSTQTHDMFAART